MKIHAAGTAYAVEIPGRCPTKGSTKSFRHRATGRIVTLPMHANLKAWTKAARLQLVAAQRQAGAAMIHKPDGVVLDALIEFARPKTVTRGHPTVPPDVDKLLRALLDAMTGVIYQDDGQVIAVSARKVYAETDRVRVVIARVA